MCLFFKYSAGFIRFTYWYLTKAFLQCLLLVHCRRWLKPNFNWIIVKISSYGHLLENHSNPSNFNIAREKLSHACKEVSIECPTKIIQLECDTQTSWKINLTYSKWPWVFWKASPPTPCCQCKFNYSNKDYTIWPRARHHTIFEFTNVVHLWTCFPLKSSLKIVLLIAVVHNTLIWLYTGAQITKSFSNETPTKYRGI